jgi:hypothetical protein
MNDISNNMMYTSGRKSKGRRRRDVHKYCQSGVEAKTACLPERSASA